MSTLHCLGCNWKVGIRFDDGRTFRDPGHRCAWFDATRCTRTGRRLANHARGSIFPTVRYAPPRTGVRA